MQRKMCWGCFSQSFLQDCCKTFLLYILTLWVKPFKFQELSSNFIINVFLKNFKCKFMFTEAYLEPSQTSMMELFLLWLSHILKMYLIQSNCLQDPFFTNHPFLEKLPTVKSLGEKSFVNNGTIFFSKFEITQWNGIITKK